MTYNVDQKIQHVINPGSGQMVWNVVGPKHLVLRPRYDMMHPKWVGQEVVIIKLISSNPNKIWCHHPLIPPDKKSGQKATCLGPSLSDILKQCSNIMASGIPGTNSPFCGETPVQVLWLNKHFCFSLAENSTRWHFAHFL